MYGTGTDGHSLTGGSFSSLDGGTATSLGPGGGVLEHAATAAYQSGGSAGVGHAAHGVGPSGSVHVPLDHSIASVDGGLNGFSGGGHGLMNDVVSSIGGHAGGGQGLGFGSGVVANRAGEHGAVGIGAHGAAGVGSHGAAGIGSHSAAGIGSHGTGNDLGPVGASVSYGPVNSFGGFEMNGQTIGGSHGSYGGYGSNGGHGSDGGHGSYGGYGSYGGHGSDGGHGSYGGYGSYGGHGLDGGYGSYGGHGTVGGHGAVGEHGSDGGYGSDHGSEGGLAGLFGSNGGNDEILDRLSELVGHGSIHEGAEILSNLISSPKSGYRVSFGENHSGNDGFDGYHGGATDSGYDHDPEISTLSGVLGSHHVGLSKDILGRLATVVGHGNVHDGAHILSQLVETSGHEGLGNDHGGSFGDHHGDDGPFGHGGFGGHGGEGIEEEARHKWWTLKNFLHDVNRGENIGALIANAMSGGVGGGGESGFGSHGNHWVGFPGFPASLFNGHGFGSDAYHIPGSPFEITMDGKLRLAGDHSNGLGGWQDMNHPFSDFMSDGNRWGGMTMVLNGEHGRGPYLLDHWGNAVNLANGQHQGFVMTGHDGHKYLFVPTSAVTGHHATGDDFHNGGWHNGHQTVLTPAGLMDLNPASHWNPTADGDHGPVLHTPSGDMTLGPHGPEVLDSPLGPLHLMPSHDGVMHLETPEVIQLELFCFLIFESRHIRLSYQFYCRIPFKLYFCLLSPNIDAP